MDSGRQVIEQKAQAAVDLSGLDQVIVVQDQQERRAKGSKVVDERSEDRLDRWRGRGREHCLCRLPEGGAHTQQCGQDIAPEDHGLAVGFIKREPGDRHLAL